MKKVFALVVVISLVFAMFVGCSQSTTAPEQNGTDTEGTETEGTDTEGTEPDPTPQRSDVTVSYMASQDWIQEAELELGAKFEEETGIKVDYQIVPSDQYQNLIMTRLNAGEATDLFGNQSGKFDIVSLLNIEKNGVDLSGEEWAGRMDPLVVEQLSVDGKLYGMTINDVSAVWAIAYNKNIFADLDLEVPSTFDGFKDVSQKILDSGITPIYESVSDGWHHVLWFPELGGRFEELNPGLADDLNNNEVKFAENETMLEALAQLKELVDLGYFGDNYMSNTYADTESKMASGEYAMTLYNQGLPGQIESAFEDVPAETFDFFVMPLVDNQILNVNPAGPSKFVYSGSSNIDEAKQYLAYIASPENLQYLVDNTPRFNTLPFSGLQDKYSDEIRDFYDTYTNHGTVYQTQVRYLNPQWMDIGKDLEAMFINTASPENVLNNIDRRRADAAAAAQDPAWD